MFTSPLIPSESRNFPDHFRQEIASVRNAAATKPAPLVGPEALPHKRSLLLLIRNLLPARPHYVFPLSAVLERSHELSSPPATRPSKRCENTDSTPVATPKLSSPPESRFAPAQPQTTIGKSIAAPISAPAKMPVRKSAVPVGLKRKARWNMRAAPTQSALPEKSASSRVRPVRVPEQKASSKVQRRPVPLPHFVVAPPPALVEALVAYAAKVSAPASVSPTPACMDTGLDTP